MEDYEAQEVEFWAKLEEEGHQPLVDAAAQRGGGVRPDGARQRRHGARRRRKAQRSPRRRTR